MDMKIVTPPTFALNLQKHEGKAKNESLKGILPKNMSFEHLMFHFNKLDKKVCHDIYAIDSQSVVRDIESLKPVQLTSGCGGGT